MKRIWYEPKTIRNISNCHLNEEKGKIESKEDKDLPRLLILPRYFNQIKTCWIVKPIQTELVGQNVVVFSECIEVDFSTFVEKRWELLYSLIICW